MNEKIQTTLNELVALLGQAVGDNYGAWAVVYFNITLTILANIEMVIKDK